MGIKLVTAKAESFRILPTLMAFCYSNCLKCSPVTDKCSALWSMRKSLPEQIKQVVRGHRSLLRTKVLLICCFGWIHSAEVYLQYTFLKVKLLRTVFLFHYD